MGISSRNPVKIDTVHGKGLEFRIKGWEDTEISCMDVRNFIWNISKIRIILNLATVFI